MIVNCSNNLAVLVSSPTVISLVFDIQLDARLLPRTSTSFSARGLRGMDTAGASTNISTLVTTVLLTTVGLALLRRALNLPRIKIIVSPLRSVLPQLSPEQVAQLEYPPDIFPGARDVASPVSIIAFSCPNKLCLSHSNSTALVWLDPCL